MQSHPLCFFLFIYSLLFLCLNGISLSSITVSLANALARVNLLEAKLKATVKALEEADDKSAKEVAAGKLAANQVVKETEARDTKAEKAVVEVSQKQSKQKEVVVKRLDDLLTSIGSMCFLPVKLYCLCVLSNCVFTSYLCDTSE
jgi:hypothetical protein